MNNEINVKDNDRTVSLTSGAVKLQYVNDLKLGQARELRKKSTPAERLLWQTLRNRKCNGLKFRRQQIIEGFIVDFFCEELNLAVYRGGHQENSSSNYTISTIALLVIAGVVIIRNRLLKSLSIANTE